MSGQVCWWGAETGNVTLRKGRWEGKGIMEVVECQEGRDGK